MFEVSRGSVRIAAIGFAQIFNHKTRPTKFTNKLIPAVQIFNGSRFTVRRVGRRRQRAAVVVINPDAVLVPLVPIHNLQTCWLLVLTDVRRVVASDSRNLAIDPCNVGDITRTDRLMNDVKTGIVKGIRDAWAKHEADDL